MVLKNSFFTGLIALLAVVFTLSGCLEDKCTAVRTYVKMEPIFVTAEQLQESVEMLPARALEDPGKIYVYENYLFINERYKGLHVIDNSDPTAPQSIGFLNIPGNIDLAVMNDILYVDNVLDLLAIDLSDIGNPVVVGKAEGVFEDARFYTFVPGQGYIVGYSATDVTEDVQCDDPRFQDDWWFGDENILFLASSDALASSESTGSSNTTGIGGSMARFTISLGYLYTVGDASLNVFDIGNPTMPEHTHTVHLGWGIETIYPYEDKLFLGSRTGMYLFDNSQPSMPVLMSEFSHWNSCDPVVVEGNTAYVTLRGGNTCDGFVNQLEIIDVSDISAPRLMSTWPMDGPYGLAIRNQTLYICDGLSGLKVYNVLDQKSIELLSHDVRMSTYDVISLSDTHLLCVGGDGLYQYDTADKNNLKILSVIPVQ